ncbi:MAG: hypothetical protein JJU46_03135 [Balneolaceae bacterium]|nr:hypothetical protein [Balneolaceae bacterium]MCH8547820.1 hypothetical protein [Balneolaceae bacterium]
MNDYSDIIMLTGAILLFSILTLQVNRSMLYNNLMSVNAEIDYHALSVAQELIDEVRWMTSPADLEEFAEGFPTIIDFTTDFEGESSIPFTVNLIYESGILENENIVSYQVTVQVQSPYMTTGVGGSPVVLTIDKSFNS